MLNPYRVVYLPENSCNTTHREDIKVRGELLLPAGNGKTSFIAIDLD